MLTRSWLIFQLTESAAAIGLVHVTRAIGSLTITPLSGVLADRMDRRILLIAANGFNAAFFILLGILVMVDRVAVWHVVASSIVAGAGMTVQNTAKQAVIPSVVPREGIMNAMALNGVTNGSSRIIGPSMAGFLIGFLGVEGSYFVAAGFLLIPIVLYGMVRPLKVASSGRKESVLESLRVGFVYAVRSPAVRVVLLVGITVTTFGMPFLQLLPVYVIEVLEMGPGTLGLLASVPGFLTVGGGLVAASLGDFKYKGYLLLLAVLSPATAALILSQTDLFWTALLATCIFGAFSSQYGPSTQTAVMKATPEELRGRVASMVATTQGLGSVGVVIYGLVADPFGIQAAYLIFGGACAALQITYFLTMRSYRQLN